MIDFITKNPVLCIVIAVIIIALIVYLFLYRKDILKKAALYAVAKAEEEWGSKTGRIKFAEVYTYLKKNYPVVTFFFTEEQMTKIIDDALDTLKQILTTKNSTQNKQVVSTDEDEK